MGCKESNQTNKYFAQTPPQRPLGGVNRSKINFSYHGHVAYQIKWNHKCSNMVVNIFIRRPHTPCEWGQKVKIQLFQNMVMLHINQNGIMNAATW